jgi:hypothetical protein
MTPRSVLIVVLAASVLAALPASASSGPGTTKMSASELNAACAAGGGHIAVTKKLEIKGGVAYLTGECDITPGPGAHVKIDHAIIDAAAGDFDVCFSPACGANAKVEIKDSTIIACNACGLQIYVPGSGATLTVKKSVLRSNPTGGGGTIGGFPAVGTNVISEGKVKVEKTVFLLDTSPRIHGGVSCKAQGNTPSTAVCS